MTKAPAQARFPHRPPTTPRYRWNQPISLSTVEAIGKPFELRAGVNLARDRMIRQVASSSAAEPLERRISQAVTRPLAPTPRRNRTVPCWPAANADAG